MRGIIGQVSARRIFAYLQTGRRSSASAIGMLRDIIKMRSAESEIASVDCGASYISVGSCILVNELVLQTTLASTDRAPSALAIGIGGLMSKRGVATRQCPLEPWRRATADELCRWCAAHA